MDAREHTALSSARFKCILGETFVLWRRTFPCNGGNLSVVLLACTTPLWI